MTEYRPVAREESCGTGRRLWDVYRILDGRPVGQPVVKAVGEGTATRIAASLAEWQPTLPGERSARVDRGKP